MRWRALTLLPALLVTGCGSGDGEDFTVRIKRPVVAVFAPLAAADVKDADIAFPGLVVQRTRPSDREILYTIPGDGDFPATVRLRLDPENGGEATVVHAFVHVPPVHAAIDGEEKVLSERKVEAELERMIRSVGRSLEMGSDARAETLQLSGLMAGVAIATDKAYLARALDFKSHPAKLANALLAFGDPNDPAPSVTTPRDTPMMDPDAADEARERMQADADWQRQEAADQAAAPAVDLDHEEN